MRRIQDQVHRLSNHLQAVLGYVELEQYGKSLASLHETILAMGALATLLCEVTKDCELIGIEALDQIEIVSKTTNRQKKAAA